MAETDQTRVLVIAAATIIDREVVVSAIRQAPRSEARVVAPAEAPGSLDGARENLDGIVNLLIEHEVPATGTIGDKGLGALSVADAELEQWSADEVLVLIDATDSTSDWEFEIAQHAVLRHGTPIAVIHASSSDLTAA